MNTKHIFRLKNTFSYLVLGVIIFSSLETLHAQEKKTNRTKKEVKVRDHRNSKKTFVKSQSLSFDEADAIFGTRTELQRKYPGLKFTGKIDRTMITKKLSDGENLIHKTVSGNTVYATVKKGEIVAFSSKGSKMKEIKDGTSNTISFKNNNKTCFKCTDIYYNSDGTRVDTNWITCVVVDCSKDYNAIIPGKVVDKE